MARVWPLAAFDSPEKGCASAMWLAQKWKAPAEKIKACRLEDFRNGVLTGAAARNYIPPTDGDAAALRRMSLGLLELLGAYKT